MSKALLVENQYLKSQVSALQKMIEQERENLRLERMKMEESKSVGGNVLGNHQDTMSDNLSANYY